MITNDAELDAAQTELETIERQLNAVEQRLRVRQRELRQAVNDYRRSRYEQQYGVAIGERLYMTEAAKKDFHHRYKHPNWVGDVVELIGYGEDTFGVQALDDWSTASIPLQFLSEMRNAYLERVGNS